MLCILIFALAACSPASVIPEPEAGPDDPPGIKEGFVSIAYLKTLYKGAPTKVVGELRISGRVVSSDVRGNFHKTLVLDDGTAGIEIKLDMEEIFKHFMTHTLVDVRCNGLWLGSYGGTLQLGAEPLEDLQTRWIAKGDIPLHLQTDKAFTDQVLPRELAFGTVSAAHISTFVCFRGVQFVDEETGLGWAESDADTDTDRHMVDPAGDTLIVRTSRYAAFADKTLPDGNGYIEGVLSYFNGKYQLKVCDDQKAVMESPRFVR